MRLALYRNQCHLLLCISQMFSQKSAAVLRIIKSTFSFKGSRLPKTVIHNSRPSIVILRSDPVILTIKPIQINCLVLKKLDLTLQVSKAPLIVRCLPSYSTRYLVFTIWSGKYNVKNRPLIKFILIIVP